MLLSAEGRGASPAIAEWPEACGSPGAGSSLGERWRCGRFGPQWREGRGSLALGSASPEDSCSPASTFGRGGGQGEMRVMVLEMFHSLARFQVLRGRPPRPQAGLSPRGGKAGHFPTPSSQIGPSALRG
ncbi:hypothetical protein AAFF_G00248930 [Aldrovandia affinis]|uniref:Uncharacterized protein n=1 Tax=Aldrovandia affinis TaxID=143900 RepID=A0AAD7W407_9TELE|nr:hypothetical protein AAFF_G00248930 [Aldrovandia affinis]